MKITVFLLFIFFSLTNAVMADSNCVKLSNTTHSYTKLYNESYLETSDGINSIDDDFNSQFGFSNGGGDPPATRTVIIISEHIFSTVFDITQVKYKMYADARANGKYIRNYSILMFVEYFDGAWHDIPNSRYSAEGGEGEAGYDTGIVIYNGALKNVTKIRTYTKAYSFVTGGEAGAASDARIYEIQAFGVVDIGLRAYDGTNIIKIACEPEGVLTSPLRIHKKGITYAIVLVEPNDTRASKFRIKTNSGIKALAKLN